MGLIFPSKDKLFNLVTFKVGMSSSQKKTLRKNFFWKRNIQKEILFRKDHSKVISSKFTFKQKSLLEDFARYSAHKLFKI